MKLLGKSQFGIQSLGAGLRSMAGVVVLAIVLWLPVASASGFVLEDWGFLALVREGRLSGLSLWDTVWLVSSGRPSYRPVGCGAWFVFVSEVLGARRGLVAVAGLAIVACTLAVWAWAMRDWWAWLGDARMNPCTDQAQAGRSAWMAVGLVGFHPAWLLPVIWTSAVAESLALLFGGLGLGILARLMGRSTSGNLERWTLAGAVVLCWSLSFLSKENGILWPLVAALLLLSGGRRGGSGMNPQLGWGTVILGSILSLGWLIVRHNHAVPIAEGNPYELVLGTNLLRNGLALGAFGLGVPRESLRLVVENRSIAALLWGGLLAALTVAAWLGCSWRRLGDRRKARSADIGPEDRPQERSNRWRTVLLMGAVMVPLLPYGALRWNSYPYYILPSLMILALVLGPRFWAGGSWKSLALAGTGLAVLQGGIFLLPPEASLIKRAQQARADQTQLRRMAVAVFGQGPVGVRLEDERRVAALGGLRGIAYGLQVSVDEVVDLKTGLTDRDQRVLPGGSVLTIDGRHIRLRVVERRP